MRLLSATALVLVCSSTTLAELKDWRQGKYTEIRTQLHSQCDRLEAEFKTRTEGCLGEPGLRLYAFFLTDSGGERKRVASFPDVYSVACQDCKPAYYFDGRRSCRKFFELLDSKDQSCGGCVDFSSFVPD